MECDEGEDEEEVAEIKARCSRRGRLGDGETRGMRLRSLVVLPHIQ